MGNFARRLDHGAVVLGEFATTTPEMKGVDFAGRLGRRRAAPSFVQKVLVNLSTCPPVHLSERTGGQVCSTFTLRGFHRATARRSATCYPRYGPSLCRPAAGDILMQNALEILYLPINEVTPYVRHARLHNRKQRRKLEALLRRYGQVIPILVDEQY